MLSNLEDVFLFSSELVELDSNNWQHVRGSALIISMKAIAIAFDISSTKISKLPPVYEYAGYVLCPASLVLGPFVTFADYKNCQKSAKLSLKLLMQIIANSLCAIVFICMSSCFLAHLISDDYAVTYRDALIFRTSHYFISFMSAATLLVSGIDCKMTSSVFGYQVTKPFDIELPRSLIPVVISWNIPIHVWVKTCKSQTFSWFVLNSDSFPDIFHNLKQFGKFKAILLTYLISSSLHGLNFQLAAVLLSIGVFTFVEHRLRNVLAEILDACVASNKCNADSASSACSTKGHKNTSALAWVKMINGTFGIFTVVLLAYLGVLLDTSIESKGFFSWEKNLKKWIDLNFFGHIIVSIWFLVYLVLRN